MGEERRKRDGGRRKEGGAERAREERKKQKVIGTGVGANRGGGWQRLTMEMVVH